jgi:hypothetical protein
MPKNEKPSCQLTKGPNNKENHMKFSLNAKLDFKQLPNTESTMREGMLKKTKNIEQVQNQSITTTTNYYYLS